MTGCHGNAPCFPWLHTLYTPPPPPSQDTLLWLFRQNTWSTTTAQRFQITVTYICMSTHTHAWTEIVPYQNLNGHKLAYYVLLGLERWNSLMVCSSFSCAESIKHERYLTIMFFWCLNPFLWLWGARLVEKTWKHFLLPFIVGDWIIDHMLSSLSGFDHLVSCKACVFTSFFQILRVCVCVSVCVCVCVSVCLCVCGWSGRVSDLC